MKLKVPTENMPLPRKGDVPPVAAVNSFGFGGTNSHIVLEEATRFCKNGHGPTEPWADRPRPERPCVLTPQRHRRRRPAQCTHRVYRDFLREGRETRASADIGFSAGTYRQNHDDRLVAIAPDAASMRNRLKAWMLNPTESDGIVAGKQTVENTEPVFVFTGQGAQWWAMGQGLLKTEPVFRAVIEEIDELLKPLAGWSLAEEMTRDEAESSQINRTDIAQPAIFALQVALAELWKSWGVKPAKVVGHSVGEVAAAYVAGVYTSRRTRCRSSSTAAVCRTPPAATAAWSRSGFRRPRRRPRSVVTSTRSRSRWSTAPAWSRSPAIPSRSRRWSAGLEAEGNASCAGCASTTPSTRIRWSRSKTSSSRPSPTSSRARRPCRSTRP